MKFPGQVRNGVVVLKDGRELAEGTLVNVEPVGVESGPRPGSAAAVLRHAGVWADRAGEVDRLLQELHDAKHAELAKQQAEGDRSRFS